jgi:hypothetical protein
VSPPEGARKSGRFMAICSEPSWCWTPIGGEKVLVPYMVACDLEASEQCSKDTFFTGQPVFLYRKSYAPRVEGNEPGVGDGAGTSGIDERGNGGKESAINNGIVWVEDNAVTVSVNGILATRHGDACWMNVKP